jgi:hypothetical protein
MVRQAAHSVSTVAAAMQGLSQTQPAGARIATNTIDAVGPAILRQTYLNCMDDRGYSVAEALAIGQLTP